MLFMGMFYQFALIASFLLALIPSLSSVGHAYSSHMARALTHRELWSRRSAQALIARRPEILSNSPAHVGTHASSGFLYFYLWRAYLRGLVGWRVSGANRFVAPDTPRLRENPYAYPSCPVLFLYGADKDYALHEARWVEDVKGRRDGSRIVALAQSRHWPMIEEADEVNRQMAAFLGD